MRVTGYARIASGEFLQSNRAAWAIDTRSGDGHGLIGIGWFGWPPPSEAHLWGNRTALFTTRREARAALPRVRSSFKRARVVRVVITITRHG